MGSSRGGPDAVAAGKLRVRKALYDIVLKGGVGGAAALELRRLTGWAVAVALAALSLAVFSERAGAAVPSAQAGPAYGSGIGIEVQPPAGLSGSPGGLGNVWEGSTLTALPGTWTGSGAIGFSYEWFRGDTVLPVRVGVGSTYTVTGSDVGSSLWVRVTATDANGSSTRDSTPSGPAIYRPPLLVRGPRIVGDPVVGNTVVADPGDWALVGAAVGQPITFTYRWYHCWEFASPQPDELPGDCNPFFDPPPGVDRWTIGEELYDPTKTDLKSQSLGVGLEVSIPDGAGATSSSVAWVYTDAILPRVVQNITAGQTLEGTVTWTATASAPLQQVVFALDGNKITSTDTTAPYEYLLDTTKLGNGAHQLGLTITLLDGSVVWQPYQIGAVTIDNPTGNAGDSGNAGSGGSSGDGPGNSGGSTGSTGAGSPGGNSVPTTPTTPGNEASQTPPPLPDPKLQPDGPLRLRSGGVALTARTATAGKTFGAAIFVVRSDTGKRINAAPINARATIAGKTLPLTWKGWYRTAARATWRIPVNAKGKTVVGSLTITWHGTTLTKTFTAIIR